MIVVFALISTGCVRNSDTSVGDQPNQISDSVKCKAYIELIQELHADNSKLIDDYNELKRENDSLKTLLPQ